MKSVPSDTSVVVHVADEPMEWRPSWSAIWVGTLAALATGLIIGLVGIALGAHQLGPTGRILRWSDVGIGTLIFSVLGAFVAFVVGGWTAARIAGTHRAESSVLHGAIVWLLAVPLLLMFAALGAGSYFGGWYGGLAGTPFWAPAPAIVDPNVAVASRNAAIASATGLLIGLMGSVLGGWMGSGERMSLMYRRDLDDTYRGDRDFGMRRSA